MGPFLRKTIAVLPVLFLSACGATVMSREVEHEEGDPTGMERLEKEGNESSTDDHASAPSEPERGGPEFEQSEMKDKEKPKPEDKAPEQQHAVSGKDRSVWSSGSAENVFDRARRQLRRRCDSGSQTACKALPDIDRCSQRYRKSCVKLGELYAKGGEGVDRNPEHARDFWIKACDLVPADCVQYGRLLFEMDGLDEREAIADHLFEVGCTQQYGLCAEVGRFYEQKKQATQAKKYFDLGCAGGQTDCCRDKNAGTATAPAH